jgi:hypothetical protein
MLILRKIIADAALQKTLALANQAVIAENQEWAAYARERGFYFDNILNGLFRDSHKLRGWHGRTPLAEAERIAELNKVNSAIAARISSIDNTNDAVGAFWLFVKVIAAGSELTSDIDTQRHIAFSLRPRAQRDRAQLSAFLQEFADTTIETLAKEFELAWLLTASEHTPGWEAKLYSAYPNATINIIEYGNNVIKLASAIADFIREKNTQEEKENKLLEKLREELTGFVLPAGLRQAIAQKLGIKPEDLDPAVARRKAEEVSAM